MQKRMNTTIDAFFLRGVSEFIDPDEIFAKKLAENPQKIVIKFGVDPTRPDIHLGHAVVLRWLRKMQDKGCKVIFLIGDLTSQIGDPTGKSKVRKELSEKEVLENMKTYLDQVGKILNVSVDKYGIPVNTPIFGWIKNSDWFLSIGDFEVPTNNILDRLRVWMKTRMQKNVIKHYTFRHVLAILRKISYARLIERDMFQARIQSGEPVFMHEMMYPIIQGIDSSALYDIYGSCDLEVGGTDQHFNMLMGREIMQINKKQPQAVLSFELLEGLDGKEKMSKSLDNYIGITESPDSMFGKIMSLPDALICRYFLLCTDIPKEDIISMQEKMDAGENPMQFKKRLGLEIIAMYHDHPTAKKAEENWQKTFSDGGVPDEIKKVVCPTDTLLIDFLVEQKEVKSKSDFRRLITEGAIKIMSDVGEQKITDEKFAVTETITLKIGKKKFLTIEVN